MNRKTVKSFVAIIALATILAVSFFVPAFAQPGDANDPLVTRSYVTGRIAQLTAEINTLRADLNALGNNLGAGGVSGGQTNQDITPTDRDLLLADVMTYFEATYGDTLRAILEVISEMDPGAAEAVPFAPFYVPAGHTLIAEAGVEFILRGGHATAVSGVDGMVDVTAGQDITHGTIIPPNHLLLVPRSDGRGLYANTGTWLMIKGRFEIVD